jgi:hypothetical protein
MQSYNSKKNRISEIDFESYSIDLKPFDKTERFFLYADEKSSFELRNKILNATNDMEEYGVFHNRLVKALYIFSLVFLPLIVFKMIKKPDDKSAIVFTVIISIGVLIKFYEITMESILMENNSIVAINYLSPIIIFLFIISFLFVNINFIKDKFKS